MFAEEVNELSLENWGVFNFKTWDNYTNKFMLKILPKIYFIF